MEDKLLKTVIDLFYRDRPDIVATAMEAIQEYCDNPQTNLKYDEVLKILHDLMNDLPPNILLYFLTTVPTPQQGDDSNSIFSELIKKSRVSLLDNIESVLTQYINNFVPSSIPFVNTATSTTVLRENTYEKQELKLTPRIENDVRTIAVEAPTFQFLTSKRKIESPKCSYAWKKFIQPPELNELPTNGKSCMKLVELCAEYVVLNITSLKDFYNCKNKMVWGLVNKNICSDKEQRQCYQYIEDLNRKLKWLRMIEDGYISVEAIKEMYGNSEIFLKERHLYNLVDESAFTISEKLSEAIHKFVNS